MATDPVAHLLGSIDQPKTPRSEFAEVLLDRLLHELEGETAPKSRVTERGEEPARDAPASPPMAVWPLPWRARRNSANARIDRGLVHFATAALVLLALAAGFGAVRLGQRAAPEQPVNDIVAVSEEPSEISSKVAEFLWATTGSPDSPLRVPNHPVIDPQGNVWVPDGGNHRFVIFSPDGTQLESWGTRGSDQGQFLFEGGMSSSEYAGVAFDPAGNIYVADSGNHRIQKFGPDRSFITSWVSQGDLPEAFRTPTALAVDRQGRVYVTDSALASVQVYDSDGAHLATWGGLGAPQGITVDGDGNVWVADLGKNEVVKFSPDGERLAAWGEPGTDDGEFTSPSGIAVDEQGRVYVSDRAERVQVFSPQGEFLASWAVESPVEPWRPAGPTGVALDNTGTVYLTEAFYGQRLQAFRLLPPYGPPEAPAPASTPETVAPAPVESVAELLWATSGNPDSPLREPNHPVIDPQGNIWVPDGGNHRFVIFAPDGRQVETWGKKGSGEGEFLFDSLGSYYGGVAFDAAGNFYVADSGNHRIQKFGPDRSFITSWISTGGADSAYSRPVALAVDPQGRVYATDSALGTIEVYDADGDPLGTWSGLGSPRGITIDADGNIWVADWGSNKVVKFSPRGERLAELGEPGSGDGQFTSPSGISVDAQGRIYVGDWYRVQVFSPEGRFLTSWGVHGEEPGQFHKSSGVTLDGKGTVYVTESAGRRLQAFRLLPPLGP